MKKAFFASVRGRVQGVGFRYSCRMEAERLGLAGWVKNMPDGSVELYAEGEEQALSLFEDWLRRGPSYARVESVFVDYRSPEGKYSDFTIRF